jgi:hypothetical protein
LPPTVASTGSDRCWAANQPFYKTLNSQAYSGLCPVLFYGVYVIWPTKQIVLTPPNLMDISINLLIWWSEMIGPSEDRKAERKKQEDRARAVSAARKRNREEELRKLHLLATEVAVLMGEGAVGGCGQCLDICRSQRKSRIELLSGRRPGRH